MKLPFVLFALLTLTGCSSAQPWLPLGATRAEPELTLVWVGRGECERLEDGQWLRRPELDYEFSVEQRRQASRWDSVKSLRRLHPSYDGAAGERTQTYFFRQDFAAPDARDRVTARLTSSLGNGTAVTDREFRRSEAELVAAGVSSLAPFDRYVIHQTYDYEAGRLTETVELNKGSQPWLRNKEEATLFAARKFEQAPTTLAK